MNDFPTTKLVVPIDKVAPNAWNPNKQNEFIYEKELFSISEFGFVVPILVRQIGDAYEIVDGEHRWRACKELGYTEIPIENLGVMPDERAKALTLVLNNVKGEDDPIKRGLIFKDLKQNFPDLMGLMPFSNETILNEIEMASTNVDYGEKEIENEDYKTFSFRVPIAEGENVVRALKLLDENDDRAFLKLIHKQDK